MNTPGWYGTAWLLGYTGFAPPDGGAVFQWPRDLTPGVEIDVADPEKLYNQNDGHIVRQRLDFRCVHSGKPLRRSVEEDLQQIADFLSLACLYPVRLYIEPCSISPPPPPEHSYHAMSFGHPGKSSPLHSFLVPPAVILGLVQKPMMSEPKKRERILRAVRWYRRALLAREPIVEFTHYAFALEAIAPFFDGEDSGTRVRSLAVQTAAVPAHVWKRVGRLRHSLFHGGLAENSDTIQDAEYCAGVAEYVLLLGLKHVLDAGDDEVPSPKLYLGQARDASLEGTMVRPQPPDRLY